MTDRCAQKIMREYFLKLNCETLQVLLAYYFRARCGMLYTKTAVPPLSYGYIARTLCVVNTPCRFTAT